MLMSANNREGGDGKGIKDEEELGRSIYHIKVNFSCLNLLCSVQRLLRRKFEGPLEFWKRNEGNLIEHHEYPSHEACSFCTCIAFQRVSSNCELIEIVYLDNECKFLNKLITQPTLINFRIYIYTYSWSSFFQL